MGCSSSSHAATSKTAAAAPTPAARPPAPAKAGASGGSSTGAASQHRRRPPWAGKRFQVKLAGEWKNYTKDEDMLMTRAFLVGHPNCRFTHRGMKYECNFKTMKQVNLSTRKERDIRPPPGLRQPKKALLPAGPMIVLTVQKDQPGTIVPVDDPNNPGQKIQVAVPASAKVGSKLAVPVPKQGERVEDVVKRQDEHSTGAKVAMAGAVVAGVGAVAVGGFVLGDHLAGGDAAEHAAESTADAAEDAAEWVAEAGEDMIDWLGDAGDAIGDFVTDLF